MARQYVTYEQVGQGLYRDRHGEEWWDSDPHMYLWSLRRQTGLSWAKLAHDLSVDSGYKVSEANARRWAK